MKTVNFYVDYDASYRIVCEECTQQDKLQAEYYFLGQLSNPNDSITCMSCEETIKVEKE